MKKLFVSIGIAILVYLVFSFIGFSFTWLSETAPRIIYMIVSTAFIMFYVNNYE